MRDCDCEQIHHHYHHEGGTRETLERIERKIDTLTAVVGRLLNMEVSQMGNVQALIDAVRQQTTVIGSVGTFIQQLRDQIANGATPAEIDGLLADVQGNNSQLSAFIENTPAVTTATEPVPA